MLKPISYNQFLQKSKAEQLARGFRFVVMREWIIDGEDRLSYTTLTRIVEFCREYHWKNDISQQWGNLDTIIKAFSAEFFKPILVNQVVEIEYRVKEVRRKGYSMIFQLTDANHGIMFAEYSIVSVFFDNITHSICVPPLGLVNHLLGLSKN